MAGVKTGANASKPFWPMQNSTNCTRGSSFALELVSYKSGEISYYGSKSQSKLRPLATNAGVKISSLLSNTEQ